MTRLLLRLTTAVFALALLFFPQSGAQGAREGLALCAGTLLPSLFPAFVFTNLAIELGLGQWLGRLLAPVMEPLFHLSGPCAAPLALGLLGGYPVGGQSLRNLLAQGGCSREEAQRLLAFCNNSGPAFILGIVGSTVFQSLPIGLFLWLVHALAALCVGLILRKEGRYQPSATPPIAETTAAAALTRSVKQALNSILQVSAYVVLFQVLLGLIQAMPLPDLSFSQSCQALLMGMLELTGGICALTEELSLPGRLALASFLLGWGGLSVHCQTAALLEDTGLAIAPYIQAKLLHGLISAGLCLVLLPLFSSLSGQAELPSLPGWMLLVLPAILLLFLLCRKRGGKAQTKPL
ncbi:MAG: sporulation protein [Oscillospiraceae bacterium]|nr:sporulation protein [Oscillospiraceae bacterium]